MNEPAAPSFLSTLATDERRLAGRLEGFGDIVFGFAVSQCALQLPTVGGHVAIGYPGSLIFYFVTFGLLASLWVTYHRLMSGPFRPTRVDLPLAFAFLAFVSLMPYAQYSIVHDVDSLRSARYAIAEYSIVFATTMGLAAALTIRNLRRGWQYLDGRERARTWIGFVRRIVVAAMMLLGLILDLAVGPLASQIGFFGIVPALAFVRLTVKKAPSARALRIVDRAA